MKIALVLLALIALSINAAHAQIYVINNGSGTNSTVGEYFESSGGAINSSLITGLNQPFGLAVFGANLFVISFSNNSVAEYDASSGALINASFITGLNAPQAITVSGGNLYISNFNNGTGYVSEYNATTGAVVNASLISSISDPYGIAVSGQYLYVVNDFTGTIGEYNATTGATINAALVTGLNSPGGLTVSGNNLYVSTGAGVVGEYNATTGAAINASLLSGLNAPDGLAVSGPFLYVASSLANTVGVYNATTGAVVNASFLTGLNGPNGLAVIGAGSDVGGINAQKEINYVQSGFTTPSLDPDHGYQFQVNVNPGFGNDLLTTSTLTPPSGSTGTASFLVSEDGLNFSAQFQTQTAMDAAFANGTYGLTIQTTTPNTYPDTFSITGNSYPPIPTLVSVTNATWVNGHLLITNPAADTVFTWTSYTNASGSISFDVNNTILGTSGPAIATNNTFTIPGGTLANNTAYQGNLNFNNSNSVTDNLGISAGTQYTTQTQFLIYTGTPATSATTLSVLIKDHVLFQTSASAPVNGSGYDNYTSPAPYNLYTQSATAGTVTGPNGGLTVGFTASDSSASDNNNTQYRYQSDSIASQTALDSTYPDGNYTFTDSHVLALTGDIYPNTPQVTAVNGTAPTWNSQGQLVLDPTIDNVITWSPFSITAGTFATNGYEEAELQSSNDNSVDIKQKAGFFEASNVTFTSLTIPAGTMTADLTYVGNIGFFQASTVTNTSTSVADVAGYQTETYFTVAAAPTGTAAQTINFAAIPSQQVVNTSVSLVASTSSGLPVTFSIVTGPATVSGNTLTFTGTGTVIVEASQTGNSVYAAATPVSQNITVNTTSSSGQDQFITFPAIATQNSAIPLTLNATASSGLPITYTVTTGPAVVNGSVLTFTGTGSVTVNADQPGDGNFSAAGTQTQTFNVLAPVDLTSIQLQKNVIYSQSSAAAPTLIPEDAYQFETNVNSGSTGSLLSTSGFSTPASGTSSSTPFQSGANGLYFSEYFVTKAAMDAAFASGTYNYNVLTSTPNTYSASIALGTDNYPTIIPQITSVTNATWSNGHLVVTNPALAVVFTFPAFNSAVGTIFFQVNNTSINASLSANGSNTTYTIPAGTLTTNPNYQVYLSFENSTYSGALAGVGEFASYQNQVTFDLQVGTPTAPLSTFNIVKKGQVFLQTSSATPPAAPTGDIFDAAPYNFEAQSGVSGSTIGPTSTSYPLGYDPGSNSGNGQYRYSSGAIASLATLNSTYADGSYTLADGHVVSLTGDVYTNVPQVTLVNGATPIWNAQGQLVVDPTVTNTITWSPINQTAGTFATNCHEDANITSYVGGAQIFKQKTGVGESSTASFNTLTIPAGTLTTTSTYVASLDYFLASSVNSPSTNVYDAAGYDMENNFVILAAPLPPAFGPTFNSASDVGVTSNGYIATGQTLTVNLNFAPTATTTLTVINNTGSGPITGTFSNVPDGGTISATYNSTTYNFTATYEGGDGNDLTLTYTPPLPPSSLTILHAFQDNSVPNDGSSPLCNLIQGRDGNFYGTTQLGGSANAGSVFKMTAAGQVTILHSFQDGTVSNDGVNPDAGLVQGPDGNFYGTTLQGGSFGDGTVFKITPQGQLTILHNFGDNTVADDGQQPQESLVLASDGNFYGVTSTGGSSNQGGVVFKITPQGQITILHAFGDGSVTNDGTLPESPLIQASDGNFYGTTATGGMTTTSGTVYKITPQGQVTILHSFNSNRAARDGASPIQGLIQGPDGNFYGTTNGGGVGQGFGTAYKMTPQGVVTILHYFNDGSVLNDGQLPVGSLVLGLDGNYYGITEDGGSNAVLDDIGTGYGTLFKMTPQGVVTILHSFVDGSVTNDGQYPMAGLIQGTDGTFYGTAFSGGEAVGAGVIFKFSSGVPVITSPLTASATAGLPFTYQTIATNMPTIYSVTNLPTGLSINPATGLITGTPTATGTTVVVLTLSNSKGPSSAPLTINVAPLPVPVVTSIENAYGKVGNAAGDFFSYTASATNTPTSYSITGSDLTGSGLSFNSTTGVISGYPTTATTYTLNLSASNSVGQGASVPLVIQIFPGTPNPSNEYNIIHQFGSGTPSPDAASPNLIFQGFDGSFYGTSSGGGIYSGTAYSGTIFNITNQGTTSLFHSFGSTTFPDGFDPVGLIQASDGNFYGTTNSGGSANLGTVFKITPQGVETILHNFGDGSVTNDGINPISAGVVQGVDGNFYGTTSGGGSASKGTVYQITPLGVVTILHSFGDNSVANDGASPQAGLIQGLHISGNPVDNNFYGTTEAGGSSGAGIVYKITPQGTLTVLHSFQSGTVLDENSNSVTDGANPVAPLIENTDGNFYGTTQNGGANGTGTAFEMTSSGAVTLLHTFGSAGTDGANPVAPLLFADDGNFYGTTSQGGSSNLGTVFQLTPTGAETLIHQFGSVTNDGSSPTGGLFQDANGNFYGTTSGGGVGSGTVFTFVTTQPTTSKPIFTGAQALYSPALSPLSFTPKALFGISSNNITGSLVPPSLVSQLIQKYFSSASDWILTGTLPQFLTFDSTSGTVSGTPIQAGTYTFSMTPVNANGDGTPQTVTLYIDVAPTISSATTASGTVGTAFSYQIAGTASPTSFGATGLPAWLSVDTTTGMITGTPPSSGTFIFSPTATNVSGTGTQQVTLTVASNVSSAPVINSATTASGTVGTAFTYQISATNSPSSYSAVSLPAGLVFDSTAGTISGTPTTAGTSTIPISVTNPTGSSSSVLTLTVAPITAPVITSSSAISCTPSTVISYQITGTNAPTTFSAQGLPSGFSLDPSTGIITGTSTSLGSTMVTLSATNSIGTGTSTLALTVAQSVTLPALTSSSTATAADTVGFDYQVTASNNPTIFNASGLPPGVTINTSTGEITGTPTALGTYNATIYLTNPTLGTSTASLTLTVAKPTFSQWATLYPNATVPTATPQNDGVPNLLKYLYDLDPTQHLTAADASALPAVGMVESGGTSYLTLTYRQYALESGLTINVQTSPDMKTWTTVSPPDYSAQVGTDETTGDPMMQVGVKASGTKQFIRINVTQ